MKSVVPLMACRHFARFFTGSGAGGRRPLSYWRTKSRGCSLGSYLISAKVVASR